jgi:2-oxoglutarate ferredoxin oxidoreductase subunit alpha
MTDITTLDHVVIRFAGDSGNDFSTLPNFPAEIRAPAGTVAGVSSFQLHFADFDIRTPGDAPDVLVAMNPAALKANIGDLNPGGILIVDTADFTARNLAKVGYASDPLTDGSLDGYQVFGIDLSGQATAAVTALGLGRKEAVRTKNMYALGLLDWLYDRPTESTLGFLRHRFASRPDLRDANIAAFQAGHAFAETAELFATRFRVAAAPVPAGTYRQISGNKALAFGLMAGAAKAGLQLFLGAYPITPASDVLHQLAAAKGHGVLTFQAEDEIAAIGAALGASFAGSLGVTVTSGPGMALKSEAMGLALMLELPLVICDIQRAGPATGMPTKTEQADLTQALFGRHGEAPIPVIAAASPADCFAAAFEAVQVAIQYRTPVILLSDGYLANGAEPWEVPDLAGLPAIDPAFTTAPNGPGDTYLPYARDEKLARAWAIPGTPGLEHRVGGIEKADGTGNVSYDPANHEFMVNLRAAKVAGIAADLPPAVADDPTGDADVLVVGWGSTAGPIAAAARSVRSGGRKVATLHLRHLNPLPGGLGEVLARYRRVIVPEMNLGQLAMVLRATFLVDARPYSRVRGLPISSAELAADLAAIIDEESHA